MNTEICMCVEMKTFTVHESIQKNILSVRIRVRITFIEQYRIVFKNTILLIYKAHNYTSVYFVMFGQHFPSLREAKV